MRQDRTVQAARLAEGLLVCHRNCHRKSVSVSANPLRRCGKTSIYKDGEGGQNTGETIVCTLGDRGSGVQISPLRPVFSGNSQTTASASSSIGGKLHRSGYPNFQS